MPHCDCGFDFTRARLKGRRMESYAVISDKHYRTVMRKESAVLLEKNPERRLTLIGNVVAWVGSLMRCPACGAWLLAKPQREGRGGYIVLRESRRTAKTVQRTGASRSAHQTKRTSSAAGLHR